MNNFVLTFFSSVMHDILATMLNKRFMEELFKPQDAYSRKAMRTVFDRLAHASIMRLNSASMDKVRFFYKCMTFENFYFDFTKKLHPIIQLYCKEKKAPKLRMQ